jgi:type II secretion system protein I
MMTSQTGKTRRSGFTLVEVLIAVAIFAIGVTAVLQGYQVSMHAMERANQVLVCTRLASQRLDELRMASRNGVAPESGSGTFSEPYDGYSWDVSAAKDNGSAAGDSVGDDIALYTVTLKVGQGQDRDVVFVKSALCVVPSESNHAR